MNKILLFCYKNIIFIFLMRKSAHHNSCNRQTKTKIILATNQNLKYWPKKPISTFRCFLKIILITTNIADICMAWEHHLLSTATIIIAIMATTIHRDLFYYFFLFSLLASVSDLYQPVMQFAIRIQFILNKTPAKSSVTETNPKIFNGKRKKL